MAKRKGQTREPIGETGVEAVTTESSDRGDTRTDGQDVSAMKAKPASLGVTYAKDGGDKTPREVLELPYGIKVIHW